MLDLQIAIGELQGPVDSAQDSLNQMIMTKRSFELTQKELVNLQIKPEDKDLQKINEARQKLSAAIISKSSELAGKRVDTRLAIDGLMEKFNPSDVNKSIESPMDYEVSMIKSLPLASDSIKLDAQYFSYEENEEGADNFTSEIKTWVLGSTQFLGTKISGNAAANVQKQVSQQVQKHKIDGTLLISASATHKNANVFSPFAIDVDKAVNVWNAVYPNDRLDPDSTDSMAKVIHAKPGEKENVLNILSGCSFGSSFIGMVHILKQEATKTSQSMEATAASAATQMQWGAWFAKYSGGFGVDSKFANDVKRMLSSQQIQSHCSIVCMGCIPTIKSNEVQLGVRSFLKESFDPKQMMDNLMALRASTSSDQNTMAQAQTSSITGGQMIAVREADVKSALIGLGEVDSGKNQMLDINTLMTSFEDYVNRISDSTNGVPLNYYIKPITKLQLAKLWVKKYYPHLSEKEEPQPTTP